MMRAFGFWFLAITALILPAIVSCAPTSITWSSPANDLSASGQRTASQRISLSSDGTKATAVWTRGIASSSQIVQSASATISGNSASWSGPTDLSSPGSYSVQVSLSSDGTKATAVWLEGNYIKSSSATISGNSASWSVSTILSGAGGVSAQVSLSSDGTNAIAVWKEGNSINASTALITGNTAMWSTPSAISDPLQTASSPVVSLSKDGTKATAVWSINASGSYIIQSSSATIMGNLAAWSSPMNLSGSGYGFAEPEMALSDEGDRATAVWSQKLSSGSPADFVVQTASATIAGNIAAWGSVFDLSGTSVNTSLYPLYANVSLSGDGTKAVAIWMKPTGTNGIVQSSSSTIIGNSASWASPIDLSSAVENSSSPNVRVSGDGGRATAVWHTNGSADTPPRPEFIQASSAEILGNIATWSAFINVSSDLGIGNTRLGLSSDGTIAAAIWKGVYDPTPANPKSVTQSAIAVIVYPASVPTLSEWTQLLLALMVLSMIGWHFHKQRSY